MPTVLRAMFGILYLLMALGCLWETGAHIVTGNARRAGAFLLLSWVAAVTGWLVYPS